jgi:ABC-type branched-subunit amino acid transport system substrate-binding protein
MLIQKRKNSLLIRLSVIGLVFCFLAYSSQCIAKEKVIKIGVLASFTGAASDVESLWVAGIKKAVEEINYRGGWKGIPIETRVFEAGGKPELTYVAAQKMIYNESVNIILAGC